MSESMTSENSSINAMRQLGAVPSRNTSSEEKWEEQIRAGNISPSIEQSRKIVNQINPEEVLRAQIEAERSGKDYQRYELPPLYKLNSYVEHGKLPDEKELISNHRKASIDLIDPLFNLQYDARTRFNFNEYSVLRCDEMMARNTADFQQSILHVDKFEDLGKPEVSGLAKMMNENLIRLGAFHKLENHTIGFKNFYFDAKGAFSLLATGRRHGAINANDWISMFSPLEELKMTPEEKDALKIPETEYFGRELSKMTAQMDHFERAVGAMNRYNPEKPKGQEMFMEISETEQHLLGELFSLDGKTEVGTPADNNFEPKKTQEITVKIQNADGTFSDKKFYTNLLTYYITADPEQDRRKYESTIKALLEVDAFNELKKLPRVWDHVKGVGATPNPGANYDALKKQIVETRERIMKNWNSVVKPFRARIADYAYEQGYNIQTGTQNVAELAYRFVWSKKDGKWDWIAEIPGPETGQDAVNGGKPIVHELTYKLIKGRGVTRIMPWPKMESVHEMIKIGLMETRGKDPKPLILAQTGLAKGAATIGLYPGEAEKTLSSSELEQVRKTRGKMEFNKDALRVLDSMLWIFDLSAKDCYMPMPIKPAYDSLNLYKVMKDDITKETVFEMLRKEGTTLQDIDFKNTTWYTGDAWEVNMKMIEDVIQMMYGREDPKYVDTFMADKVGGMGDFIKKMDIGTRAEKWELEVRKSLDPASPDYKVYEKIEVPKGFIEIMQTAYLFVTHMALVKHKIWDKGGWKEHNQSTYWEDVQSLVTVAAFEPEIKGKFEHYSETLQLMIVAIAEWYAASAKEYNNEAAHLKDKTDEMTPRKESYTEPGPIN